MRTGPLLVLVVVLAVPGVAACSDDDPEPRAAVPVPTLASPLATGRAGADQLARLVEDNLRRNNPDSDPPRVRCDDVPTVAAAVEVPCELRFGDGPPQRLRVVLEDDTGNFRFGPA